VHDDLSPVDGDAGRIGPEHDRKAFLGHADTAKTEDVVLVEGGRPNLDDLPPLRRRRLRDLADVEAGDRVVGRDTGNDCCEH
jgi:hypothetical protein